MSVTPIKEPDREAGITIRYKEVGNNVFHSGLRKLDEFTKWKDPKDIHRFNKLKKTVEGQTTRAANWFNKLVRKHAVMEPITKKSDLTGKMEPVYDDKGVMQTRPKFGPRANGEMDVVYKDRAAFDKDCEIFHAHSFHVKVYKFYVEDLLAAGLTPLELRHCAIITHKADAELLTDDDDIDLEDIPEDLQAILADEVTDGPSRPGATAVDVPSQVSGGNGSDHSGDVAHAARPAGEHEGSKAGLEGAASH